MSSTGVLALGGNGSGGSGDPHTPREGDLSPSSGQHWINHPTTQYYLSNYTNNNIIKVK
jgi:hypothetical protein